MSLPLTPQLAGLRDFAERYDLILCDIWGVIHNGVSVFPQTLAALASFRDGGKRRVILVTNAPRPDWWVKKQLDDLGVPAMVYDAIVTSGDVTRMAIIARAGEGADQVFALGPEKDRNFYDGLPIRLVSPAQADLVCVTGLLDDEAETPEDYGAMLEGFLARDLPMICANPDIVVERGHKLVYCGGALAQKYREMGGKAHLFGKPHAPIYARAAEVGAVLCGSAPDRARVLAIGDGVATDIKGANDADLDCLFITGGIHSAEAGPLAVPTPERVGAFLAEKGQKAEAFMFRLQW